MEEIDYKAVVTQLQLENEMLRRYLHGTAEVYETIVKVPNMLQTLWYKATNNKMGLLIGIMILYWSVSIALMVYEHFTGGKE